LKDISYYRKIHGSLGSPSPSETDRREATIEVSRDFYKSLDVDKFIVWDKHLTEQELFLNTYNKEFSTVIGHKEEFTCLKDTQIQTGSIIYNPKEDIYWLCMYVAQMDYIYKKGILYRCNTILRWKDSNNNIWEYPACDINSTQYNSGVDQGRNVDYVTSQHKITTTSDENTNNLTIDTRFFLGKNTVVPDVFKLTQNDTSSQNYDKGLVSLTLLRGQYDPDIDILEDRISNNNYNNYDPEREIDGKMQLVFTTPSELIVGGKKKVSVTSSVGTVGNVVWDIAEDEYRDFIIITPDTDNSCMIEIKISKEAIALIGSEVTLLCKNKNDSIVKQRFIISGGV